MRELSIEFGSPYYQLITEINASVALLRYHRVAPSVDGRYECFLDDEEAAEFVAEFCGKMQSTPEEAAQMHALLKGDGYDDFDGLRIKQRSTSAANIVVGRTHYVQLRLDVTSLAANSDDGEAA